MTPDFGFLIVKFQGTFLVMMQRNGWETKVSGLYSASIFKAELNMKAVRLLTTIHPHNSLHTALNL